MKQYKFYIIIALFFASCTDLNEEIYDKIPEDNFPENEAQAALAIVPTYQELADLIDDAGWWFWAQEVSSDEIVFPVRLTDWDDGGKWRVLHQHAWDNNTDAVNSMWSHFYDGVFEANKAIDKFLVSAGDPASDIAIAKLKTLRAFYYYLLIDNYGDVPFVTSFFDAPAQPEKTPRATIHEEIVKDLEDSYALLPVGGNKFAVSKGMAFSLLAKLYLNAEVYTGTPQWEKAGNYCDSVINLGLYSLTAHPLEPFKADNETSPENIFTIPFDEQNLKGFRLHLRTLHYQHNLTYDMTFGPWNGCGAVEDHYNTFVDNDLRKDGFIVGPQFASNGQPLVDGTAESDVIINPEIPAIILDASYSFEQIRMSGARIGKYEIEKGAGENMSNDFPLFRYADILLMKAETEVRQNRSGDSFLNEIRMRAGINSISGATLDDILEERGREMFAEGHRRQDLIRFGEFTKSWWEKSASTAERNIFPIPQWAIDANPNLGM